MIESMVSVGLVVVGLVGIFGLITRSINMNKDVQNRVVATYLAAEGIEIIKNIIDTNVEKSYETTWIWNQGLNGLYEVQYDSRLNSLVPIASTSTTKLTLNEATGRYMYGSGLTTPYTRTVKVSGGGDTINVNSFVEWTTDNKKYVVHLSDVFLHWRARTTQL